MCMNRRHVAIISAFQTLTGAAVLVVLLLPFPLFPVLAFLPPFTLLPVVPLLSLLPVKPLLPRTPLFPLITLLLPLFPLFLPLITLFLLPPFLALEGGWMSCFFFFFFFIIAIRFLCRARVVPREAVSAAGLEPSATVLCAASPGAKLSYKIAWKNAHVRVILFFCFTIALVSSVDSSSLTFVAAVVLDATSLLLFLMPPAMGGTAFVIMTLTLRFFFIVAVAAEGVAFD